MAKNTNLHNAKSAKNDEFYTQLTDIEKEMKYYRNQFKDKVVYCNCDDARESNFFKFFKNNFESLGLKKLITTGFKADGHGVVFVCEGDKNGNHMIDEEEINTIELEGNGDFRSEECINFLKEADIVVTNPPFSLFREYVAQLMEYEKKFIIIGNGNAVTYKEIFPLIKENKIWMGVTMNGCQQSVFIVPNSTHDTNTKMRLCDSREQYSTIINTAAWFTNMEHNKRHESLDLYKKYSSESYPKYDNYDAIEVSKVADIPEGYPGIMGVPISFIGKYCPEQFEVIGITENADYLIPYHIEGQPKYDRPYLNGKRMYSRLLIKSK